MPSYVVRASRAPDSPYLYWSTVVDNATYVAPNRDDMAAILTGSENHDQAKAEERLRRADEFGSSAIEPEGYLCWDDPDLLVTNTTRRDAIFFDLPRDRLAEYALAYLRDDRTAAEALLVPHPIEDAATQTEGNGS